MILFVLAAMTFVTLSGCGQAAAEDTSLADIKAAGKFVVGLDDSFPPMGFVDENNELGGFDIDLAKEVAMRLGVEAEFKPTEWDGIVLSLINKDIDVVWNGMTITEERLEKIAFSNPYFNNEQIVIVKPDSGIETLADLSGKTVGTQLESSGALALRSTKELSDSLAGIREYGNNVEALMDLENGRIVAVVVDQVLGRYYIESNDLDYLVLEESLGTELYGIGIRKEDVSLKEAIDATLAEMIEDGTAGDISKKWFGEDILVRN